jgi:PAS domain S-box-containing protein
MLRLSEVEQQLESSLAQSREIAARYRSLIETVPHIVFTAAPDGACDYVSEQFSVLTGRPTSDALGYDWLGFVHPADRDQTASVWRAALQTHSPFQVECRFLTRDGTYRWLTTRVTPVTPGVGLPTQWIGTATDTHDRKLLLEEIEHRHSEFVSLAEHSPDVIARLDPELRHTYVNSTITRLTSLTPAYYLGKTNRELGFPDHLCDIWDAAFRQVFETGQRRDFEFEFEHPTGTRFLVSRVLPELAPDGSVASILAVATDITERKRAELALAENERRLRRLVESNVIGIAVGDHENITSANGLLLDMLGYSRAELDQGGISWRAITPPEYFHLDEAAIRHLQTRGVCDPYEKEYFRKDGSRVPILIGAAALDSAASEWVCFILDLTRLKQAEAALQSSNRALQRSNEELAHFAYAASHDLREPLRTISNYVQLLDHHETVNLTPLAQQSIRFIQQAVSRMESLIQDLLTFSLAQNIELSRDKPIPATAAVSTAIANLQGAIEQSGAVISVSALPNIHADLGQLTLVFQNLIGNSIKYRSPDRLPEIDISAARHGAHWLFQVRDNGIGFDPTYADRIFRVFSRLHGREVPGSGVGLAIVKKSSNATTAKSPPKPNPTREPPSPSASPPPSANANPANPI